MRVQDLIFISLIFLVKSLKKMMPKTSVSGQDPWESFFEMAFLDPDPYLEYGS